MTCTYFWFVEEELLPSPTEAVADTLKTSAVWLVGFSCATVIKSLKEAVVDPTWVQSTVATTYGVR